MKKFFFSLIAFAFAITGHTATLIEPKVGGFMFYQAPMNQVYYGSGIDVQIATSFSVWRDLQMYAAVEWYRIKGESLNFQQKTVFSAVPLSLGLKPTFPILPFFTYYFTIGPRYVFAFVDNDSSFVQKHMDSNGFGGFFNTGFVFPFSNGVTIDIFGEISYVKLDFHSSKANTQSYDVQGGGLVFGGALGYSF
jgi:hypothetical protein